MHFVTTYIRRQACLVLDKISNLVLEIKYQKAYQFHRFSIIRSNTQDSHLHLAFHDPAVYTDKMHIDCENFGLSVNAVLSC